MASRLSRIGVDRAVALVILGRGWGVIAGLINIILISHLLTGVEQGFYYTFNSIIALQVFFELGLSTVLAQFASHEMAVLHWTKDGGIAGPTDAQSRLHSLLKFSVKWYAIVGPAIFIFVTPLGFIFFSGSSAGIGTLAWAPAWALMVFFTAINLFFSPLVSISEGLGMVAQVAKMRLMQAMIGSAFLWLALFSGLGLASIAVAPAVLAVFTGFWLKRNLLGVVRSALQSKSAGPRIHWKTEIFPMQWRIAISWLCGYFIYQLFTPIAFRVYGATVAGQLGMSIAVTGAVSTIAMSWINTRMPLFGGLIANKKFVELDQIFFRSLVQSSVVLTLLSVILLGTVAIMPRINTDLSNRILPLTNFVPIVIAAIANHIIYCQACYIRAAKKELFLPHAITLSIAIFGICGYLGMKVGLSEMLWSYAGVMTLLGITYAHFIFSRFRTSLASNPT